MSTSAALPELFSLSGRTALVTGGSSGIGRAITTALAAAGAHVLIAARREGPIREVVDEIAAAGASAAALPADLGTREGARDLAERALAHVAPDGRRGVDVLVCSAGINLRPPMPELDVDTWDATMAVNLDAPFLLGQALAPAMAERGCGRLIHISSQQAHRPFAASGAYGVSKAALEALARSQAEAWSARGVTANVLIPGFVPTPLNTRLSSDPATVQALAARTLVGRNGRPEDFAGPVVWLASAASAYVTGQSIAVDGGFSVH